MEKFARFARIAETEFSDFVISTQDLGHKLRIYTIEKSFIDFYFTTELIITRFSIHWERSHVDGTVVRIDNTPDIKWQKISTYPVHFHEGKYERVKIPPFEIKNKSLENILREFLRYARKLKFTDLKLDKYSRDFSDKEIKKWKREDKL